MVTVLKCSAATHIVSDLCSAEPAEPTAQLYPKQLFGMGDWRCYESGATSRRHRLFLEKKCPARILDSEEYIYVAYPV